MALSGDALEAGPGGEAVATAIRIDQGAGSRQHKHQAVGGRSPLALVGDDASLVEDPAAEALVIGPRRPPDDAHGPGFRPDERDLGTGHGQRMHCGLPRNGPAAGFR